MEWGIIRKQEYIRLSLYSQRWIGTYTLTYSHIYLYRSLAAIILHCTRTTPLAATRCPLAPCPFVRVPYVGTLEVPTPTYTFLVPAHRITCLP